MSQKCEERRNELSKGCPANETDLRRRRERLLQQVLHRAQPEALVGRLGVHDEPTQRRRRREREVAVCRERGTRWQKSEGGTRV